MTKEELKAQHLVSMFLTELPHVEGKPAMQTEEAKQCAIIACKWMKDSFAGELHKGHYDRVIGAIRKYNT